MIIVNNIIQGVLQKFNYHSKSGRIYDENMWNKEYDKYTRIEIRKKKINKIFNENK